MTLAPLDQYDPRLRQVCAPITKAQLRTRQQQLEVDALLGFVFNGSNKNVHGVERDWARPSTVGLSANQVGIMKQISVVDLSIGRIGYTDLYVLINPRVVWHSKAVIERSEGCLNLPSIWGLPRRSRAVRVAAMNRSGYEIELELTGWAATLVQHEIDHLNGRLFIDRLPDTTKAHKVEADQFGSYRQHRGEWSNYVDVTAQAVPLPELYQPPVEGRNGRVE
jgi:peptide deformylase